MTMLLIMEAIDKGKLSWNEKIRTSEYAASMGGSQIFLEPGEEMTTKEMLKGIAIGSGNDASVAMAERIAGSEDAFVDMMNAKAKELGLKHTHFKIQQVFQSAVTIAPQQTWLLWLKSFLNMKTSQNSQACTKHIFVKIPIKSSGW